MSLVYDRPVMAGPDDLDGLLAEQIGYYRARAPHYLDEALTGLAVEAAGQELEDALEAFAPTGDVLELACGPGTWTSQLLRHASSVTVLDASPEMLEIARTRVIDHRVRFIQADIFKWWPDRRYDVVFFGFWLSHVPPERFGWFWALVADCLAPGGRVFFADDAYRTPDELVEGAVVRRRLSDGSRHRLVKTPHDPASLRARLTELGWDIEVRQTSAWHADTSGFYWGSGVRGA
ncbi:MAG: class I SAM-dependent methyltransferase [Actinomycetota bacterium]|nr:class I SAM-dependent methyltransferase [Actinomycetota bacterium]